jgi:hypothetical protein
VLLIRSCERGEFDVPEAIVLALLPETAATAFTIGAGATATAVSYAAVIAYGAITAAGIAAAEVSRALQPGASKPGATYPAQIPIRQPTPPRLRSYGRVKVAGAIAFEEVDNTKALWIQYLIGQGEIDYIEEFWLGDDQMVCDGALGSGIGVANGGQVNGNYPTNQPTTYLYGGVCVLLGLLGTADQLAQTALVTAFPGDFASTFRWRGVPNVTVLFEPPSIAFAQKAYSYGPPNLRTVQRAAKLYDPRVGTQIADSDPDRPSLGNWTWSQNAGLVILDFMRHPDGWSRQINSSGTRQMVPIAQFNVASFIAFANLSDQQVALKGATFTISRYLLSGTYDLTTAPKTFLEGMLAACDCEIYRDGQGLIAIRGGAAGPAPTVVISEDHIIEHHLARGAGKFSTCNRINAKFVPPRNDYQQVDMDPWIDQANIDLIGEELVTPLDLTWIPNHSQSRRVAKINIAKLNPLWSGLVTTDAYGLLAYGERFITLEIPELGIDDSFLFLVKGFKASPTLERVQLTVAAFDISCYDWNAEEEEGTAPVLTGVVTEKPGTTQYNVPVPFGFACNVVLDPATGVYRGLLTWSNQFFLTLFNQAQYSVAGTAQLFDIAVPDGATSVMTDPATPLNPAVSYDFAVRCVTPAGKASLYVGGTYTPP